jgi:NADPH-dependent 2,4-dienoyl-CoA reductase/sulfur reductase-like enzyme/ferredoxin
MDAVETFPNYMQMPQRVPLRVWFTLRALTVAGALALCVLLIVRPRDGLTIFWGVAIPLLPLLFFIAPGVWRNVCPLAAANQTPRVYRFTRGLTAPDWLRQYGYLIAVGLFVVLVPMRKILFNGNGTATAVLILLALTAAFLGGLFLKGKSGWCSSFCPLLPVQRVYGQTPFVMVPNSHCQPCIGCTKNCYDFNPGTAYFADMTDPDPHFSAYRKLFVGAFPGLVIAFFRVSNPPAISNAEVYGQFILYMAASAGIFFALDALIKTHSARITVLFGATALSAFYYYTVPLLAGRVHDAFGVTVSDAAIWSVRVIIFALAAVWVGRTWLRERQYAAQASAPLALGLVAASPGSSVALRSGASRSGATVTFHPEKRSLTVDAGRTVLEAAEACGLHIEAGCRMGMCGADPIAVLDGMDRLSPVRNDERTTLERLGLGENTRMACCARVMGPVSISLKPERPAVLTSSMIAGFKFDRSIEKVVIIGNGIAGITAADHVRRRHPLCSIDVIGRESHNLYNRMGIERLIYGRSAMQGLYLLDDQWYEQYQIGTWLNTRAAAIDPNRREVTLSTGEALPYDRLVLAMGSSSSIPPIGGFGMPGTFVLREAADAIQIRAYVQEHNCRTAAVAGGGLLGLEAAYALTKLGLQTAVLERSDGLLRRQLDKRGGDFLREHLEGLGVEVLTNAETASVIGDNRVRNVLLKDDRNLVADVLVVAAGITPNIALAKAAGIDVNRGVIVDDMMRTSSPDIYACGDVAEHHGQVYGLWPSAVAQAETAAVNLAGGEQRYEAIPPVTMLKVVGVDLTSVGRIERQQRGEMAIADIVEEGPVHRYRKVVIADNKIVGAILLGFPLDAPLVTAAVRQGVDVSSCISGLRAGEWDVLGKVVEA